jgi:hypothetical protein
MTDGRPAPDDENAAATSGGCHSKTFDNLLQRCQLRLHHQQQQKIAADQDLENANGIDSGMDQLLLK